MALDFIIAGGGIGGTVLAHLLAQGGKKVLVIEKNTAPPAFIRPEGLWPATADLLRTLLPQPQGKSPPWLPLNGIHIVEQQQTLLSIGPENFARAGVQLALTDPNWTREQLLRLKSFQLRRGAEVTGVLKEKNRIAGVSIRDIVSGKEEDVAAAWTIGDDGVNSVVRKGCGLELKTQIFPLDFMTFGFSWPASLPDAVVHVFLDKKRSRSGIFGLAAFPMPGGKGAGLLPVRPAVLDSSSDLSASWTEFRASNPRIGAVAGKIDFPGDLARIRRPWGHAKSYGIDGAILIGDAAHPVSPVGGQGANMAVADAAALADVILSGKRGIVSDYERRRRPANGRSIDFTRRASQALALPAFLFNSFLSAGMRNFNKHPERFEDLLRSAAAAFQE